MVTGCSVRLWSDLCRPPLEAALVRGRADATSALRILCPLLAMASPMAVVTPATELNALDTESKAGDIDVEEKASAVIVEADSGPAPSELRAWLVVLGTLCVWPTLAC